MTDRPTYNVLALTQGQPFCAGVVVTDGDRLLVTLNSDGLPQKLRTGEFWRVGGVGGGQEPLESILECAAREGREELNVDTIELISAPTSYFHDLDTDERFEIMCADKIAPLLVQRMTNPRPDTPYKPGLPVGPYLYFAQYLATPPVPLQGPGDDVEGLLWLPFSAWGSLEASPLLHEMLEQGASLIGDRPMSHTKRLWTQDESVGEILKILLKVF